MFGKKILFLLSGYIAGNAVASAYGSQKKKTKNADGKQHIQHMVENFLDTQKRFIGDIEKKYLSEENRELLSEKKKDFLKLAEKYTQEGQDMLTEIQKNQKFIEGKQKAQGFFSKVFGKIKSYAQEAKMDVGAVKEEIETMKEETLEKAEEIKMKVEKKVQDGKIKGKKLLADAKKKVEKK